MLPDSLVLFLFGSLLNLKHVLEVNVILDDGCVILLLFVQFLNSLLILLIQQHVLGSLLLLKDGLLVLKVLHQVLVELAFLFYFLP